MARKRKRKSPPKSKTKVTNKALTENRKDVIVIIISIISLMFSVYNLYEMKLQRTEMQKQLIEMQTQRHCAYKPDFVFETAKVYVSWEDLDENFVNSVIIPVTNIGVGAAKQISFIIDEKNFYNWFEVLQNIETENQYEVGRDKGKLWMNKIIPNGGGSRSILYDHENKREQDFLLPNAEEIFELEIPRLYLVLLCEIFACRKTEAESIGGPIDEPEPGKMTIFWSADYNPKPIDVPDLEVLVFYEDVQGQKYEDKINIGISEPSGYHTASGLNFIFSMKEKLSLTIVQ